MVEPFNAVSQDFSNFKAPILKASFSGPAGSSFKKDCKDRK
jgi:hypothetical protein